jgi:hypothetical protein
MIFGLNGDYFLKQPGGSYMYQMLYQSVIVHSVFICLGLV